MSSKQESGLYGVTDTEEIYSEKEIVDFIKSFNTRGISLTLENTGFQTALDNRVFGYRC